MSVSIVVPTIGRSSLSDLLASLARANGERCDELVVVDDRARAQLPLKVRDDGVLAKRTMVVQSGGRGPAAARNCGWMAATGEWIAFLDDDVIVAPDWKMALRRDVSVTEAVAATQGTIEVPLPQDRRPTDWERNVAGLERSLWITADMAYRRVALQRVGGFDERFPRAYREDSDLALRVARLGYKIVRGSRRAMHPVRTADRWVSVRLQRGNADDVLMCALHGRRWRSHCGAGPGRMRMHAAIVGASALAVGSSAAWAALVGRFAYERIAPGPCSAREIATMLATSAAIPYAALYHRARAWLTLPRLLRKRPA